MDSYGINSVLSEGNINNTKILGLNKQISIANASADKDFKKQQSTAMTEATSKGREAEATTYGEALIGQVGSKGKDIEAGLKTAKSILGGKASGQIIDTFGKYAVGGLDALTEKDGSFSNLFKSDEQLVKETGNLDAYVRLTRKAERGTGALEDAGEFLAKNVTKGANLAEKTKALGKLGVLGAAINIGQGAYDVGEDIAKGKIVGKDTGEKVGNVLGAISGGLEVAGLGLDLTGAGAPVGVALNLAGGLVGLAGAVASEVGESQEEKQTKKNIVNIQPPQRTPQQAISNIQSTGAVVR